LSPSRGPPSPAPEQFARHQAAQLVATAAVVTGWRFDLVLLIAAAYFLPFVPALFRYSRVIWMHFDRAVDPTLESEQFVELRQPMLGPHEFPDDARPRTDTAA
jgi:hypothetical protein